MICRKISVIVICLFLCACMAVVAGCGSSSKFKEKHYIESWADGDTAKLKDGRRLRLIGLDTPETAKRGQPAGYYGREAMDFSRKITNNMHVTIVFFEDSKHSGKLLQDDYNRFLCEIILSDNRSLNEELLRAGMAYYYPFKDIPQDVGKRLLDAQKTALKKRTGCWKKILAMPQAQEKFIGNKRSMRFASEACAKEYKASPKNQVIFSSMKDALEAGYSPSRNCNIWPPENF